VSLTGNQLEQVIYHVSLMMTDTFESAGHLHIDVRAPTAEHKLIGINHVAAVISITGKGNTSLNGLSASISSKSEKDTGVILSVIETLLQSAEGNIEFVRNNDGHPVYQISVPYGNISIEEDDMELPEELCAYMSRWTTLIAVQGAAGQALCDRLKEIGTTYEWVDNVISVLSRIETIGKLDAIVVARSLLGQEADGLLKAINKLFPATGIVVLTEDADKTGHGDSLPNVLYRNSKSSVDKICSSMIEAKSLSVRQPGK
jgi:hypothetical protein